MNTTLLTEIMAFLFGRKYYICIYEIIGRAEIETAKFVFTSKQQADEYKKVIDSTASMRFIETISFRSRKTYG